MTAFFRLIFLSQVKPLIQMAKSKTLTVDDIEPFEDLHPWIKRWTFESSEPQALQARSFLKLIFTHLQTSMFMILGLALFLSGLHLVEVLFLKDLIQTTQATIEGVVSIPTGLLSAFYLTAFSLFTSMVGQHYFLLSHKIWWRTETLISSWLYQKLLKLSYRERLQLTAGGIVNLATIDSGNVARFLPLIADVLEAACTVILALGTLIYFLGFGGAVAAGVVLLFIPLTRRMAKKFAAATDRMMEARDQRVAYTSQVLTGIRLIKYFAWGRKAVGDITGLRQAEVKELRVYIKTGAYSLLLFTFTTGIASITAFAIYLSQGHHLDAPRAFAAVALLNLLRTPMEFMAFIMGDLMSGRTSLQRLAQFFNKENNISLKDITPQYDQQNQVVFSQYSCGFDEEKQILHDINLSIRHGEAIAVVGPVGAGKSTLLLAILNEVAPHTGTRILKQKSPDHPTRCTYVPQTPIILNRSVQDNVLFGQENGDVAQALDLVSFRTDLLKMPDGMATDIGEHGVNLSGGQKQRIALARAIVQNPNLVLLDDPLSAVDHDTEIQITQKLLMDHWQGVTRVVVTHRLDDLHLYDRVIYMDHGRIQGVGPLPELLAHHQGFAAFYRQIRRSAPGLEDSPKENQTLPPEGRTPSPTQVFVKEEDKVDGSVAFEHYRYYLQLFFGWNTPGFRQRMMLIVALLASGLLMPVAQNFWLSRWMNQQSPHLILRMHQWWPSLTRDTLFLIGYGVLSMTAIAAGFALYRYWGARTTVASALIHDRALKRIIQAPLRYFDRTPIGQIINRLSKDVEAIDFDIAWSFENSVMAILEIFISVTLLLYFIPVAFLVLIPILTLFYRLQRNYRAASRDLRRLNSILRSNGVSHFKETIEGLLLIRVHHQESTFERQYLERFLKYQRIQMMLFATSRWFSLQIPILTSFLTLAVTMGSIFLARSHGIAAGTMGLLLMYCLNFWQKLSWGIRSFSVFESKMISVERLARYEQLDQEQDLRITPQLDATESIQWPSKGAITFSNVIARYDQDLPVVLNDVSFSIPGGSKVAIVGRTGAGKTTIFQTLFRFIEIDGGSISIDGKNICGIPLDRLRSAMSVIPQDPQIFLGPLRQNLDPFGEFTDAAIWEALDKVQMKGKIAALAGGLTFTVKEDGLNFSQGERQLMCLARAILRKNRILLMDEATASVDVVTDQVVHQALAHEFRQCTIVVIAHRINTILDCDFVLEMGSEEGPKLPKAAEYFAHHTFGSSERRDDFENPSRPDPVDYLQGSQFTNK